jgi:hypothetical protein
MEGGRVTIVTIKHARGNGKSNVPIFMGEILEERKKGWGDDQLRKRIKQSSELREHCSMYYI